MTGRSLADGCIYGRHGLPLRSNMPGLEAMMAARSACTLLYDVEAHQDARGGVAVDLVWCLPFGAGPHGIAATDLAAVVSTLDGGGAVAIHGTAEEAVTAAIGAVLPLLGGGRA